MMHWNPVFNMWIFDENQSNEAFYYKELELHTTYNSV